MFKVNNKDTRTIKTPGVFISNFEYIRPCSVVYIVNFESVNAGWVMSYLLEQKRIIPALIISWSFHDGSIVFVVITIVIFVYTNTSYYFCAKFSLFQSYK